MKEVKLKNNEILTISSPTLDDAQQLADYANKIRCETKFITMSEEDEISTPTSQEKWIQSTLDNIEILFSQLKLMEKWLGAVILAPNQKNLD